jgi:hypothetical protein
MNRIIQYQNNEHCNSSLWEIWAMPRQTETYFNPSKRKEEGLLCTESLCLPQIPMLKPKSQT